MHVSVVMTAFNAERWVAQTVDSILNQTYRAFELIAVNDGSTDRTLDILQEYAALDARISIIDHENRGMGRSANEAIEQAQYDWIARIDADDIMLPHRLERQVAFITENPDVGVASCLVEYINERGAVIGTYTSDLTTRSAFQRMKRENQVIGFHHPGVIMRKDLFQQVGGYRPEYWSADDLDLWNRIAELDTVLLVQPEYLVQYRVHGSSVSHERARDQHLKVRWLEHNMLARRAGNEEVSLEQFRRIEGARPRRSRLNQYRQDTAKILYKSATLHYSSGNRRKTATSLAAALLLYPTYTLGEVNKKFLHIRRRGAANGSGR